MSQSKKDTEASTRHRLPAATSAPPRRLLDEMLSDAQRSPGRLIELPLDIQGAAEPFSLTVEIEPAAERPVWTLYAGEGASSRVLWTYVLRDTDMICEVLSLSVGAAGGSPPPPPPVETEWREPEAAPPPARDARPAAPPEPPPAVEPPPAARQAGRPQQGQSPAAGEQNVLLGHILVDAALSLQEMVREGALAPEEATEALRKVNTRKAPLEVIVEEIKGKRKPPEPHDAVDLLRQAGFVSEDDILKARSVVEQLRRAGLDSAQGGDLARELLDLLKLAGFVSDDDIQRASRASSNRPVDVCKALLSSNTIESLTFEVASRFVKHVRRGSFKQEQAVIALHYSQRCRTGFEETVHS